MGSWETFLGFHIIGLTVVFCGVQWSNHLRNSFDYEVPGTLRDSIQLLPSMAVATICIGGFAYKRIHHPS